MKISVSNFHQPAAFVLGAVLTLSGCSKKPDVKASTAELEKAFPAAVSAAPAEAPAAEAAPVAEANSYVKAALSSVQANDYAGSVIALQTAQRVKGVTADQLIALERAKQAMTASLLARADRGDPKAIADLKAIEKTRSQ
jgi:hypothetical protein